MKHVLALTVALFSGISSWCQQADHIVGLWLSEEKDGKIEVYKHGDKYFGKLVASDKLYEPDGKTLRKDVKNADPSLRSRPLKDLILLTNFHYKDGGYTGGKIYDPKNGKTYSCNMTLKGSELHIRGYIGAPMFGRTAVFTRAK